MQISARRRVAPLAALFAALAIASPHNAAAALRVCNPSPRPTLLAIGYAAEDSWTSQGWWQVDPNSCSTVLSGALGHRYYYYYAWQPKGTRSIPDKGQDGGWFCLSMKPFKVGDVDCRAKGYRSVQFREVDTGSGQSFTLELETSSP